AAAGCHRVRTKTASDQLITGIREVHRGGSFLNPKLLNRLMDGFRTRQKTGAPPRQPRLGTSTKREREILKILAVVSMCAEEGEVRPSERNLAWLSSVCPSKPYAYRCTPTSASSAIHLIKQRTNLRFPPRFYLRVSAPPR